MVIINKFVKQIYGNVVRETLNPGSEYEHSRHFPVVMGDGRSLLFFLPIGENTVFLGMKVLIPGSPVMIK